MLPQSSRVCSSTHRAPRPLRPLTVGVASTPAARFSRGVVRIDMLVFLIDFQKSSLTVRSHVSAFTGML